MAAEQYHNLVIGSGAGGKLIAWTLAAQGQKTIVVERSMIGGSYRSVGAGGTMSVFLSRLLPA